MHTARLKVISRELPLKGSVGFELFNNADLGLTEFAQKVNYQRALQGELSRTIMSLEEIESARVHLSMPESGLFRRNGAKARASIALMTKAGQELPPDTVRGIQRLVAAAVPELEAHEVTIVNPRGAPMASNGANGGDVTGATDTGPSTVRVRRRRVAWRRSATEGSCSRCQRGTWSRRPSCTTCRASISRRRSSSSAAGGRWRAHCTCAARSSRHLRGDSLRAPGVISLGHDRLLVDRLRQPDTRDLPAVAAAAFPRAVNASSIYDVLLDPARIENDEGRAKSEHWAQVHADLTANVARDGLSRERIATVAHGAVLADLSQELVALEGTTRAIEWSRARSS